MAIFDTELLNYQKVKFKNLVLAYVDLQNIRLLHNYVPMHAHACPYSTLAATTLVMFLLKGVRKDMVVSGKPSSERSVEDMCIGQTR